jgi:ribosomal protein S13
MMDFFFIDKILPFLKRNKSVEELSKLNIIQFYIQRFGIGKTIAYTFIFMASVHHSLKISKYFPTLINKEIKYVFEDCVDSLDLMLEMDMKKRLRKDVQLYTYRGDRYLLKLPLHGQRRRANGKTTKKVRLLLLN